MTKTLFNKSVLLILMYVFSINGFAADSKPFIYKSHSLSDTLFILPTPKPLPKISFWGIKEDFPVFKILLEDDRQIKYVENNILLDCIKYNIFSDNSVYKVGEKAKIILRLEFIDGLQQSWRNEDCQKLALKVALPVGFVQTGGSYYDFMQLEFNDINNFYELTLEGTFNESVEKACFV